MALTDFKLIHPANTSITSIADIATNGMVAGNVAKAADVNAIFKQNSLIGVGLLTGLNALGNTNNTSTPNDTDLTKITTYFSNALSLTQPTLASNVLTIGLGAQTKTIDLSSVVVANASEATHATSADTALMANAATSAMNAGIAGVAHTLGSVDVGSESQAIYLDEGTPKTANIFANSNNICVCQTLVKNMNGATVSGVYFNNYSYQGYTVKQLQDGNGNPITDLDTIKNYLKQMTGHKRVPIYDQFTPLNEYLVCSEGTDKDTIWKLQYGSSTGLLAFRVDNLPYFASKAESYQNAIVSTTIKIRQLNETTYNDMIRAEWIGTQGNSEYKFPCQIVREKFSALGTDTYSYRVYRLVIQNDSAATWSLLGKSDDSTTYNTEIKIYYRVGQISDVE